MDKAVQESFRSGFYRGFTNPELDSQRVFRTLLTALSEPGRVCSLPVPLDVPPPLAAGAGAACLALADFDTPLWLDAALRASNDVCEFVRFHCGSPLVDSPSEATLALVSDAETLPELAEFQAGDIENPERAATLIVQVREIDDSGGFTLSGPGVKGTRNVRLTGVRRDFVAQLARNHARFPLGVDLFCVADRNIVGLPRTIEVGS